MFLCARICIKVDLEKGLQESIILSIDGWNHLQTMDYEKIPFKCKYCHEYGHFAKSCPKKPDKPNPKGLQEEGWNVASGKKSAKSTMAKQPHIPAKNAPRNKFEALHIEEPQMETPKENEEEAYLQEQETLVEAPSPKQKDARVEDPSRSIARKGRNCQL